MIKSKTIWIFRKFCIQYTLNFCILAICELRKLSLKVGQISKILKSQISLFLLVVYFDFETQSQKK